MVEEMISIEESFLRPSAEYPDGSYLCKVGGKVQMATGFFEKEHPGYPSPYWHGKAPVVMWDGPASYPWRP